MLFHYVFAKVLSTRYSFHFFQPRLISFLAIVFRVFLVLFFSFLLPLLGFGAQIKLAWDPNSEPDLAGYKVYYGAASSTYGSPINVGNVATYTLTGLTQGQVYYVAVTAYDTSNNESGYSNEVSGAATGVTQTFTVTTNPSGLQVVVDGAPCSAPCTFTWEVGSSHPLSVSSPQAGAAGTRYVYASWSDGGAQNHAITAPSSSTTYTANFTTQYSLTTGVNPAGSGTVSPSGTNWYNSGQSVSISAAPAGGYTFSGWTGDLSGAANPTSITMNNPKNVTAQFTAIPETISTPTTPSGPSSGTVATSYNFSTGSSSSNLGHSVEYRFDWGDGTYSSWSSSTSASKAWSAVGTYAVKAQARCATHTAVVSSWSNALSVAISPATLTYNVITNPSGLQIVVDSVTYMAPQTFNWQVGSSHSLSVSSPQSGGSGTRYVYTSWSDGGAQSHTITAPSSSTTYTANFITQYSLTTGVNPAGGGTVSPFGTNWYGSGQSVSLSATPNSDYTFAGWSGDLSGSANPASVTMNGPKNITAQFGAVQESISAPVAPSGASSGVVRISYSYVASGASSNLGHSLEYQFDWKGDGSDLSLWGAANQQKAWTVAGQYNVRVRARCSVHPSVVSAWSSGTPVTIQPVLLIGCPDGGIQCLERTDGGNDGNNLVNGKPKVDVEYEFKIIVQDTGGTPEYVRLFMAQRNNPAEADFYDYDMSCNGDFQVGANCTYRTKLGPAAFHTFHFMAKMSGGTIITYPNTGYITGPQIQLLKGNNLVGIPRDINKANLDGQAALGSSKVYRWNPNGEYYSKVTTSSPSKAGEGYLLNTRNKTLLELASYGDVPGLEYTYPLEPGLNLISNPYAGNVKLSEVKIQKNTQTPVSWQEAASLGWVINALYSYNGRQWGDTYSHMTSEEGAQLVPWLGYWINLNVSNDNYYLVIPRP